MFVTIVLIYTYTLSIRCRSCKEVTAFLDTDIKAQKINMKGEVGSQSRYDHVFLLRKQYRKISTANQQHSLFRNDYLCISNINTWISQFSKVFRKTFVGAKQEAIDQLFDHRRLERVFRHAQHSSKTLRDGRTIDGSLSLRPSHQAEQQCSRHQWLKLHAREENVSAKQNHPLSS